jgi:hypothetical protein
MAEGGSVQCVELNGLSIQLPADPGTEFIQFGSRRVWSTRENQGERGSCQVAKERAE